jgi:hypothetical protein
VADIKSESPAGLRRNSHTIEESSSIKILRDTLLPKLISGELRIADAEAQVSAA